MSTSIGNPGSEYRNEYREFAERAGVRRATTARLVLVKARKEKIQGVIQKELRGIPFPALYMLVKEETASVYVGESGETAKRIKQHVSTPPTELGDWDYGIVIWDGRPIDTSRFNEASLRDKLEYEVITALESGGILNPVNKVVSPPALSHYQETTAETVLAELLYMLMRLDLVTRRVLETKKQRELDVDEQLLPLLRELGGQVSGLDRAKKVLLLDGQKAFYRPGSEKPRGWQITIRGTFKDFVEGQEDGFLIISRGTGYLVPIGTLRDAFLDLMEGQDTLDIFVNIEGEKATIMAHDRTVDISDLAVPPTG